VSILSLSAGARPAAAAVRSDLPIARTLLALVVVVVAFATLSFDDAVVAAIAGAVLVVLAAIDIERGVIPNRIVLPASALVFVVHSALVPRHALQYLFAALVSAAVLAAPTLLGRNWIGAGDAKLALLVGAALGWAVAGALLAAFALTFPVALLLLLRRGLKARKATLPFGPFIALGSLLVLFGPALTS
jgi:leader peptidase (prepilin peptidase) / N-methyltransferase